MKSEYQRLYKQALELATSVSATERAVDIIPAIQKSVALRQQYLQTFLSLTPEEREDVHRAIEQTAEIIKDRTDILKMEEFLAALDIRKSD